MLIDVVSRGGNLCLDIGPRADGTIPVIMQERLLLIGAWLETNGEAIYGTRMWKVPCQWSAGRIPKTERKEYMSRFNILEQTIAPPEGQAYKEVLFTFKNKFLNAITPKWPGKELILKDITPGRDTEVILMETKEILTWKKDGNNLVITTPEFDTNKIMSQHAYVFQVSDIEPSGQ
jgi:alpha-L-fucosidase